jgi:hypothetical protein
MTDGLLMSNAARDRDADGPGPGGGTDVLDEELEQLLTEEQLEDGDHERFAHYVQKEKILESALSGKPVIALCGKVWVPGRDPDKFPVCPDCKKIYDKLK